MRRLARRLSTLCSGVSLGLCVLWAFLFVEFFGEEGYVFIPIVTCFAIAPVYWLVDGYLARRAERRTERRLCPSCGYDLRASSERCPECGAKTTG
jgi:phosphatidylglycerophosphate synthase